VQAVSKEEKSVHKKEWKRVGLGPTGEDTFMGKNRTRDRTGQGIFPRGLRCCKQQQSACESKVKYPVQGPGYNRIGRSAILVESLRQTR